MSADWFRFERDTVLRAGAGAGKTQALVGLYLHLIGGATARRPTAATCTSRRWSIASTPPPIARW